MVSDTSSPAWAFGSLSLHLSCRPDAVDQMKVGWGTVGALLPHEVEARGTEPVAERPDLEGVAQIAPDIGHHNGRSQAGAHAAERHGSRAGLRRDAHLAQQ